MRSGAYSDTGLLESSGEGATETATADSVSIACFRRLSAALTCASLRLDNEIFEDLSAKFPELVEPPYEGLVKLNEEWMKSSEGKTRWRDFIEAYKDKIKDYNFGSLIRTDANDEYSEKNTIFGEYLPICAYTRRHSE